MLGFGHPRSNTYLYTSMTQSLIHWFGARNRLEILTRNSAPYVLVDWSFQNVTIMLKHNAGGLHLDPRVVSAPPVNKSRLQRHPPEGEKKTRLPAPVNCIEKTEFPLC